MKNEKLNFLDFDLDTNNNKTNTEELDLLLNNKKNKLKNNELNIKISDLKRQKELRNKRLQIYTTNDIWLSIQQWKHLNNIKKDSEAIEILIRIGLKSVS